MLLTLYGKTKIFIMFSTLQLLLMCAIVLSVTIAMAFVFCRILLRKNGVKLGIEVDKMSTSIFM